MTNRRRPPSLLVLSPFLVLSSLTIFAGNLTAVAQCLQDQSSALLRLKEGFSTNRSTTNLESWKSGTDCCDHWEGVTCDPASSGRVTALDLSNRFISGRIDPILFNLTSLTSLNLAYNLFNQSLPSPGFEKLANLTRLNLSNAGLYGQIPSGISRLTKLVSLDLSTLFIEEGPSTSLKLRDPDLRTLIANLINLRELYLDGINISSDGSEWCTAVSDSTPGLQALSLVSCSLSGPIHSSLSRLRSLSKLRLDRNGLNSSVPEFFGNFSSLTMLRLSACGLTGSFPARILQLRNLALLDVSGNTDLSGNLPGFPEDSTLESLVLSNTNFSGTLPGSIGNLKSLTELQLSGCRFSGAIPYSFSNLTQLVHLDLSFNNLSGELPSMARWRSISDVVLKNNRLSGSITSSLGNRVLPNLTVIDLTNNSHSGEIPVWLFSLPSLQNLLLSQNQFSGHLQEFSDPSSTLSNVDLSNNKLQGPIPKSVFRLSGLKILNLSSNNFSGTVVLDLLRSLRNLSNLDLSNNRLSVIDGDDNSSWASFPNISTLRLVSCNLNKLPGFLRFQDGVSTLDLSMNSIGGSIPQWIWSIGNYSYNYLNLSFNMFTSVEGPPPDLSDIGSMMLDLQANMLRGPIPLPPQHTIVLDYSNNSFASSIPSNFGAYLNFTVFLSLSSNGLTGEIPPSICNASYLQVLDLSDNSLNGSIPSCLLEGSNGLGILNLRGNRFQGALPQNFDENCALRTINLNGNQLSGSLPRSLARCRMLEILDLGNNSMVDSFPYWLGEISTLRVLVLRSNEFYGDVGPPAENNGSNGTFEMLQIFDLSSNNFSGSLPPECFKSLRAMMAGSDTNRSTVDYKYLEFSRSPYYQNSVTVTFKGQEMTLVKTLTIFTSIDFSSNRFEGGIPGEIEELNSLVVLNMSHNALTGEIPPHLGDLLQLESLDLSSNLLSGGIPQQLISLTFLSSLNLSYNNLSGTIPDTSQFSTFTNASFLGNEGLCGSPLSKQCNSAKPPAVPESSKSSIDLNWQFIFTGLGFGVGLAMVVGPLMVWTKGKRWYNKLVDRLLWPVIPRCLYDTCGDGKVGDEDMVDDSLDMEEEDRRFCVFCTKLQFVEGRVIIHHVECSCLRSEE
ncbi:receptor-like protein 47 [Phoenix dactylifera]|uniref:Receptor-like protein 47 n=1 Tax=Phoenix dactylifera TaxID=42345 RepID=A0A8B7C0M5_PHODC|nr:receptor-like protein 47 [Phoenix dactylifera]